MWRINIKTVRNRDKLKVVERVRTSLNLVSINHVMLTYLYYDYNIILYNKLN